MAFGAWQRLESQRENVLIPQPSRWEKDRPRHVQLPKKRMREHAFGLLESRASQARFAGASDYFGPEAVVGAELVVEEEGLADVKVGEGERKTRTPLEPVTVPATSELSRIAFITPSAFPTGRPRRLSLRRHVLRSTRVCSMLNHRSRLFCRV